MRTNLAAFGLAAFLEIAGCFAFWLWLRRGMSPWVAIVGIASLIGFAVVLTRVDSAFAGRAYAAYGGIYIAASLLWAVGGRGAATHVDGCSRCGDRYRGSDRDHWVRGETLLS